MTDEPQHASRRAELLALAQTLRPELHRYAARLMGSVIDGEEVVQDSLIRALVALDEAGDVQLRPWLFRIAHNRALDMLRSRSLRTTEPLSAAEELSVDARENPEQSLERGQALQVALCQFVELPILQRSVIVMKDVLDEPLVEIAQLLELSVDAVKAHLARGRANLRALQEGSRDSTPPPPHSDSVVRYVALFNRRDWDGLRALLADDVRLNQATHPVRAGAADVGTFFGIYAKMGGVWLRPGWLEGREVVAAFEARADRVPSYFMWLEWRGEQISFIHDYRYARYVMLGAQLTVEHES